MITLSKLERIEAGTVPMATLKDGKCKVRMTPVTSEQARAGWVASFVEDEWPRHSLYLVDTEEEARALAQQDLDTLLAGAGWAPRSVEAYYWSVR